MPAHGLDAVQGPVSWRIRQKPRMPGDLVPCAWRKAQGAQSADRSSARRSTFVINRPAGLVLLLETFGGRPARVRVLTHSGLQRCLAKRRTRHLWRQRGPGPGPMIMAQPSQLVRPIVDDRRGNRRTDRRQYPTQSPMKVLGTAQQACRLHLPALTGQAAGRRHLLDEQREVRGWIEGRPLGSVDDATRPGQFQAARRCRSQTIPSAVAAAAEHDRLASSGGGAAPLVWCRCSTSSAPEAPDRQRFGVPRVILVG